jgi:putative transposase
LNAASQRRSARTTARSFAATACFGGPLTATSLFISSNGKPTQNAKIESLNGRIRDELLNPNLFRTIDEVRVAAERWRIDYNEIRPHSTLGYLTPREFAARFQTTQPSQLSVA